MSEQPRVPEDDRPAGAIPTEQDAETHEVVTESGAVIDVEGATAEAETMIGEGDPLPVGANGPDAVHDPGDPPGMPTEPDDLDRELAVYMQRLHDSGNYWTTGDGRGEVRVMDKVRIDNATVQDALAEAIHDHGSTRSVRDTLVSQVQSLRKREREAAERWARGVREQQEGRDEYTFYRDRIGEAENALYALGLDIEGDHVSPEPTEEYETGPVISDDMIH